MKLKAVKNYKSARYPSLAEYMAEKHKGVKA